MKTKIGTTKFLRESDFIRFDTRFDSDCELVFGVGEPVVEYEGCESSSDAVSFPVVSPEAFIFPRVLPRSTSDDVDTRFPIALLQKYILNIITHVSTST